MMMMFFPRTPGPRKRSLSKPKASPRFISFLPLLVFLMMTSTVMAGLDCQKDSECRRSVCIFEQCKPRPTSGGVCQTNNHCLKVSTDVCITNVCSPKSNTGGDCDETPDCSSSSDECTGGKCTFNPSLLEWEGNKAITILRTRSSGVAVGDALFVFGGFDLSFAQLKSVEKYNSLTNTWEEKAPASIALLDHSVVAVGPLVFLIGGYAGGQVTTTFFSYNTETDQWDETWNQLPKGIANVAAAVIGNTVYLFGGQDGSGVYLNTILSIDTSNKQNQWIESSTAFLEAPLVSTSAVAIGTDIYILGGATTSGGNTNKVYKYNTLQPATSPVDTGKNMIVPRFAPFPVYDSANQRLYALVGDSGQYQDSVEYLDLSDSSAVWKSANAPNYVVIQSKTGGLIGSKFYITASASSPAVLQVFDFSNPQKVEWSPFPNSPITTPSIFHLTGPSEITVVTTSSQSVAFYDISSNSWTAGTVEQQLPVSRAFAASAAPKGVVHVMGGIKDVSPLPDIYYFDRTNGWTKAPNSLPSGRARACAASSDTQIFFYGGILSATTPDNSLFVSNLDANGRSTTWTKIDNSLSSTQPTAVTHCAAVVANGKLLIFGGGTGFFGNSPTGLIQSFDISSGKWDSPHSSSITPRSYLSAVLLKDFVFIIGGSSNATPSGALAKVEVFDTKAPFSSTSAVTAIEDMPTPRFNLGSVTDGSSIFSIGGQNIGAGPFPSLERLRNPVVPKP